MITTWEVRRKPNGELDEIVVHYARRVLLGPGSPGRWELTIDLAEGGRLLVLFRSAHGIRGTFDLDEISPRCPWLGTLATPLAPSKIARYRADTRRGGRLLGLEVEGPNTLHMEKLQDEVFWMSISMPKGDLLVSRLISAAAIVGDLKHESALDAPSRPCRLRRLPRRPPAAIAQARPARASSR